MTTNRLVAPLIYEGARLFEERDQEVNKRQQAKNLYDELAKNNIAASNDIALDKPTSDYSSLMGMLICGLMIVVMVIFWSVTWGAIKDVYAFALE